MSVFHLELTTASAPLERLALDVRAVAAEAELFADIRSDDDDIRNAVLTLHSGLWVSVTSLDDEDDEDEDDAPTLGQQLGVDSVATVDLLLNGRRDAIAQLDEMLVVVFRLLERVPGDAVLHYEDAEVWFVRRGGELILNDDDEIWIPDRLARVPPPYRRVPLAAPTG